MAMYDSNKFKCITKEEYEELLDQGLPIQTLESMEKKRMEKVKKLLDMYDSEKFPCLTVTEWTNLVLSGKKEAQMIQHHQQLKDEIDKKIKKLSMNHKIYQGYPNELRVVVLGKTGDGKSAVVNSILEWDASPEDISASSVTQCSSMYKTTWKNGAVLVADTPGLQDTDRTREEILKELSRIIIFFPQGIHVFIYVMNLARHRFTKEDREVLNSVKELFGANLLNYMFIVLTHADSICDFDIATYVNTTTAKRCPSGVFFTDVDKRIISVNNKGKSLYEKQQTKAQIMSCIIHTTMIKKKVPIYTNVLFKVAKEIREKTQMTQLQKELSPTVREFYQEHPGVDMLNVPKELFERVRSKLTIKDYFSDDKLNLEILHEIGVLKNELDTVNKELVSNDGLCTYL